MELEIIGLCVAWVVYPMTISTMLYIIKKNFDHKKVYESDNTEYTKILKENVYQKWLHIFSLAVMITVILQMTFYLTHKIPGLCLVTYILQTPCYTLSGVLITYYQIARLQYCFSVSQIHSKQYGISKYVFGILYTFGMILPLLTLILTYYGQSVTDAGYFGCHWVFMPIFNTVVVPIILLYYLLYDFLVLGIYIYKIHQIRKNTQFDDDNIYLRINFILDKIKILTIIYEIKSICNIVGAMSVGFNLHLLTIALPIMNCIDVTYSLITIYLMQEHNEHEYMKLIKFVNKHKILCSYCCCKRSIDDAIRYKEGNEFNENNKTTEQQETTAFNTTDVTLKMEHEEYHNQSECTTTITVSM